jgi:hypothetical protein
MHYVTHKSHRMQKLKFSITCPDTLFMESIRTVPPKSYKQRGNVSNPWCTGMHYVTHISHRMQKHKFGITHPIVLSVESIPVPPEHEK